MRWLIVVAMLAAGALFVRTRLETVRDQDGPVVTQVNTTGLPPALRSILVSSPDPSRILGTSGALPGLSAIKHLFGHSDKPAPAPVTFADIGTPRQLRLVRRDVRRDIAAINRISAGASPAVAADALAGVYSAPVLDALGGDGRRAFAERVAGRVAQRIKVLGFDGIFVSHRHGLAQVVYRMSVRQPSGRYLAGAAQTWTVTLSREGGRWRFVRGLENR